MLRRRLRSSFSSPSLAVAVAVGAVVGAGCVDPGNDNDNDNDDDDDVRAPFVVHAFDNVRITSHSEQENFQKARTRFDVGDGPFAAVTLKVDLATTCFPFSRWADDPPPAGENYPPSCDAFDRNFHFTLDEPDGDGDGTGGAPGAPVPLELVRAITPFGGPLQFEVDLTDLMNAQPGAHTLTTHITTFSDGDGLVSGSDGGWNVSADIDVVEGAAPRVVVGAAAVYFDNLTHDRPTAERDFVVPPGTTRTRLEVRTTGHGGGAGDRACIGPAEEFCARDFNTVIIGANVDDTFSPWLESCEEVCTLTQGPGPFGGTFEYCAESPTGNIQSVQAPRANWCPGRVTPPHVIEGDFGTGTRTLALAVGPAIADGGSWFTSAVAIFYGD